MIGGSKRVCHRPFNPLLAEVASDFAGSWLAGAAAREGLIDEDGWM